MLRVMVAAKPSHKILHRSQVALYDFYLRHLNGMKDVCQIGAAPVLVLSGIHRCLRAVDSNEAQAAHWFVKDFLGCDVDFSSNNVNS